MPYEFGSSVDVDGEVSATSGFKQNSAALNFSHLAGGISDDQHGDRIGGSLHALATGSNHGFMSSTDKTKLDGLSASPVTSVFGRTGAVQAESGDYSFSLISGTITDAQHGNRSGGSLHAAASGVTAGFMSAADKTKLDGIASGANNYTHPNHTGDVTSIGDGAQTIAANAVTFAKFQQVSSGVVLGRSASGTGNVESIAASRGILRYTGSAFSWVRKTGWSGATGCDTSRNLACGYEADVENISQVLSTLIADLIDADILGA